MKIQDRYDSVISIFESQLPDPKTELHYSDPYSLLVAVILSAQCTDVRVNMVTPDLLRAFPTPRHLAKADPEDIFPYISSISYPNNKAKLLAGMARTLCDKFDAKVPDNIDDLLSLPGVGRKTANVILSVIFNKAAMAVDTHVFRVAERIGLTTAAKTPLATEKALVKHIPSEKIPKAHHWLILHGRYICKARRPDCGNCYLTTVCRFYAKNLKTQSTGIQ